MIDHSKVRTNGTQQKRRSPSHSLGLAWCLFAAGAWILFEQTNNGPLSAAVFCLNYGFREVVTGVWILTQDRQRLRGLTCCLLFVSYGLWKVVLGGIGLLILYTLVASSFGHHAGEVTLALVLLVNVSIFSIAIPLISGLILAVFTRQKIWLDSTLWRSVKDRHWPPTEFSNNRFEVLSWAVLATSLVLSVASLLIASNWLQIDPRIFALSSAGVTFIVAPSAYLLSRRLISEKLAAQSPEECWTELEDRHQFREFEHFADR